MKHDNDIDLIAQTLDGNRRAFRLLVERYERPIFKMVSLLINEDAQVEEIAQETFLRAYKSLSRYTSAKGASFSTWLFTIARNLCFNALKTNRRRQLHPLDVSKERSDDRDAESHAASRERAALVRDAILTLPLEFRNAVVLSCIEELSIKEIAHIERCSEGTVKSRIFRGKKRLHGVLKPLIGE